MFWSSECSFLRAEGFFCNLDVLYGGLGTGYLGFFLCRKFFFPAVNFFNFLLIKTLDPDWIRIRIKWLRIRNTAYRIGYSTFRHRTTLSRNFCCPSGTRGSHIVVRMLEARRVILNSNFVKWCEWTLQWDLRLLYFSLLSGYGWVAEAAGCHYPGGRHQAEASPHPHPHSHPRHSWRR